jgi:hypothetical protein
MHRPLFTDRFDRTEQLLHDAGPVHRPKPRRPRGRKETTCARLD